MSSTEEATIEAIPDVVTGGLIAVSIIFPVVSLLVLGLRFRAHQISKRPFLADDWSMVIAWIFTFGASIMAWVFGGITGIDHYWNIDLKHGTEYSTMFVLLEAAYIQFPLAAVKIAILMFYKRIFNTPPFKLAVNITIPVVAVWGLLFFFLVMFQSNPVRGSWTGEGYLVFDSLAMGLGQVGSSIALDVVILCFPLPVIFGLHMPGKRKIAVASIFWLGLFCCIAASVRLWLIYSTTQQVIDSHGDGYAAIYSQTKNMIFAIIEPNCSVIAGCLPCLGPLLKEGRAAESLIRSVRSVFSIGSAESRRRNSTQKNPSDGTDRRNQSDTDIELQAASKQWNASQGGIANSVHIGGGGDQSPTTANQIKVIREVDVVSH